MLISDSVYRKNKSTSNGNEYLFCLFSFAVLLWSQPYSERQHSPVPTVCHAALLPHVRCHWHCHLHEEKWHQLQHQPRYLQNMKRGLLSVLLFKVCLSAQVIKFSISFFSDMFRRHKKGTSVVVLWNCELSGFFCNGSLYVSTFRDGVWPTGWLQCMGLYQAHQ